MKSARMLVGASAALVSVLAVAGCKKAAPPEGSGGSAVASAAAPSDAAPVAAKKDACAGGDKRGPLTWREDDFAGAQACARQRGVPLVVDMWAPWCHTCLSMSQYVLTDPAFAPFADRFVFVGIDTDRETNADVVAKLPINNWPTYFVLSPDDGAVQARFVGSATVPQFRDFLAQGEAGFLDAKAGGLAADDPLRLVRDGDRAVIAKDLVAADAAYTAALAKAPADWARRPDVLVALIGVKYKRSDLVGCVDLGLSAMDQTGKAASVADFLVWATSCAEERAKDDPAKAKALREHAVARLASLVDDATAPLSVDDRSDAMANLRELHEVLGDKARAHAVAERQRALLDDAAAKAPSPMAASTYNWPRAEVYVYLERPLDLVPVLEQSAKDLPTEYDPLYRLSWVQLKAGKLDDAKASAAKAAALAYGPRKAKILALAGDIAKAQNDKDGERAARAAVVALYQGLPAGQVTPDAIEKAKAALAAVDAPAAPVAPVAAH
ncbi:MAG: thioredoxin family protein [Deltaproteobacteria bacterium]|nr:thioredoxin family protein [Deltaproteobacteria bacterium]